MVKNFKCPGCGATMEYDPQDGKMHCVFCKSSYEPDQIGRRASSDDPPKIVAAERETARKQARIAVNVAVCNSCGAELAVNAVEASSFCPYCGNASVVMDRVEEQLAPDYIIPFKVSKEEAEGIIRKRLKSGFFVPKEVRDFELEKLNGVYIPFWLYEIYYGDDQIWSYSSGFDEYQSRADVTPVIAGRLTLAELEATTCARLTGFLTLDFAGVAGEEAGGLQRGAVSLFIHLAKSAGDSETNGLCLTFGTTTYEGNLDVKLTCSTGDLEGLIGDVPEGSLLEVLFHGAAIDHNAALTGCNINTSDS